MQNIIISPNNHIIERFLLLKESAMPFALNRIVPEPGNPIN